MKWASEHWHLLRILLCSKSRGLKAFAAARGPIPTTYHPSHPRFGRKYDDKLPFIAMITHGAPQPTGEAAPVTPAVKYAALVVTGDYVAAGGSPKNPYAQLPPSPTALSRSPDVARAQAIQLRGRALRSGVV